MKINTAPDLAAVLGPDVERDGEAASDE